MLFFSDSSSLQAKQKFPLPNFQELFRKLLHTGRQRNGLGVAGRTCFSAPVVLGCAIFLLHARSDFVGGFSLSSKKVVEGPGRSSDGGWPGFSSISLGVESARPF